MFSSLLLILILGSSAFAETPQLQFPLDLPKPISSAIESTLESARKQTINGNLLGYVYFEQNLCSPCTQEFRDLEMKKLKQAMVDSGADIDLLFSEKSLQDHRNEILEIFNRSPQKDLLSLRLYRTAKEAFDKSIFLNCLDFAKSVGRLSIENGFPKEDIKFFWTMDKEAYLKMCPTPKCTKPILPRPFVHTMVAFKKNGLWWAINVEMNLKQPNPDIFYLGKKLPKRLGMDFMVTFPKIAAGKKLVFAGAYDFKEMVNELPAKLLLDITISGKIDDLISKMACLRQYR